MTRILRNLTERDIHVLVNDELVLLPAEPRPTIVSKTPSGSNTSSLDFSAPGGIGDFSVSVGTSEPGFTIGLPEPEEGVYLLVDIETLLRLPYRKDLLTPAYHTSVSGRQKGERLQTYLSGVYDHVSVSNDEVVPLVFDEDIV